jgi:uncharacterized protein (TIGR02594 family)
MKQLFEIAEKELGVHEVTGAASHPRILEYHSTCSMKATSDEIPWCSAFVNWVCLQGGVQGTGSAAAKSWITWGAPADDPIGAIVVIQSRYGSNHVGLCVDKTDTSVSLLGGNQQDCVKISKFPLARWSIVAARKVKDE